MSWFKLLKNFYGPFEKILEKKYEEVAKKETSEKTGEKCPSCTEGDLMIKFGRFGKFIACSRFPECKYTRPILELTGIKCPKCKEGDIAERMSKRRRKFYGCSKYPECDFALWNKPTGAVCDQCGSLMVMGARKTELCSNKECPNSQKTGELLPSAASPTSESQP
jgi:DNA topoisomerase-1